ncbi:MAG TPA: adenosylmethionine--8-amino-7-oxononanoate transaminase [Chthoniobacterales bacterium]
MANWPTEQLAADDKRYLWHPFTAMGEWCADEHEPVILVEGEGAVVRDSRGREYIDGNASIWTNVHGHNHPHINAAIRRQLERVAHTSFLGTTNPPAIELARAIVELVPGEKFGRVFFSDDGSTGMEAALRIASQYWRLNGQKQRQTFVAFHDGYHGDTLGAASLGAAAMFRGDMPGFRAPVRIVGSVGELSTACRGVETAAVVIEPIIQGAAGMKIWTPGLLRAVREWCDETGTLLIADEVMTGFGRTGKMFACEHEEVEPDILVFGKGLTGGYLPLALTLVTNDIFAPFLAPGPEATLFYGHSYSGNAVACAAALASLQVFEEEETLRNLSPKIKALESGLESIGGLPGVANVRSCGMIGAIDLSGAPRRAARVCQAARGKGLLTRNIRNTVTLVLPLCVSESQIQSALNSLKESIIDVITPVANSAARPLPAR